MLSKVHTLHILPFLQEAKEIELLLLLKWYYYAWGTPLIKSISKQKGFVPDAT